MYGRLEAIGLHNPAGLLLRLPILPGKDLALNASYGDALESYKGGVIYWHIRCLLSEVGHLWLRELYLRADTTFPEKAKPWWAETELGQT